MAQCPVCSTELKDDFGLIDCPGCGASLFMEFDGQVLRRDERGGEAPPPIGEPPHYDQPEIEPEIDDKTYVTGSSGTEAIPFRPAPAMVMPEPSAVSPVLDDLGTYANSSASGSRDGAYHYDLLISGIDSSDVRNSVREVLNDALFLWDVDPLIRSINNGELKLAQVTAIKAALIVQRMSELPVKIKWAQHALVLALMFCLPAFSQEATEVAVKTGDSKEKVMYSKQESKVNTLGARVKEANESFAKIVELKSKTKDPQKQQNYAEQLAAIAKERNQWVKEYTALKANLQYRYPNKGQDIDKKFAPRKERTPEELENSEEIDELLTAIKKRVDKKYAPLMPKEDDAAAEQAVIAAPTKPPPGEKKKLRLIK